MLRLLLLIYTPTSFQKGSEVAYNKKQSRVCVQRVEIEQNQRRDSMGAANGPCAHKGGRAACAEGSDWGSHLFFHFPPGSGGVESTCKVLRMMGTAHWGWMVSCPQRGVSKKGPGCPWATLLPWAEADSESRS